MRLSVINGAGEAETIIATGLETPVDRSGVIAGAGDVVVMEANDQRAGWFFQNAGGSAMRLIEIAGDPLTAGFVIAAGQTFPPPGYPVTVGEIRVRGIDADKFTAREW